MWLLGAGASASAGIPTARDMVWEFKQRLFVSQRRVNPKSVADLSDPAVRAQLQAHVDSLGGLPRAGAPDEYASLFETVFSAEPDRRAYLESKLSGAKPSYGHYALATLMRVGRARLVWTTNFDPLLADACAKVFDGTGALTTVALDAPELALQCIGNERWPVEVKLHGDFRSRRLKNTSEELRHQDKRLQQILIDCCRRYGLIVMGCSGRDSSVMDTLHAVLDQTISFPAGLFWLHRGEDPPFEAVQDFLMRAAHAGVEVALVRMENFDETMRDVLRLTDGINDAALAAFCAARKRGGFSPCVAGNRGVKMARA